MGLIILGIVVGLVVGVGACLAWLMWGFRNFMG